MKRRTVKPKSVTGKRRPVKRRRLVEQDKVSVVLTAIEKAWSAMRRHHRGLPPVALITASGEGKARGHFWAGQWTTKTGGARHEVMIAGEILAEGGISVMRTLLHEGAHALAHAREVQDVSRGGRWHNKKFKEIAEEMGLVVEPHKAIGHITTDLTPEAKDRWAEVIAGIDRAIVLSRRSPPSSSGGGAGGGSAGGGDGDGDGNEGTEKVRGKRVTASCGCTPGRKISVAAGVFELGPIACGVCLRVFEVAS